MTDAPVGVDVWIVGEVYLWGLERVLSWEVHGEMVTL